MKNLRSRWLNPEDLVTWEAESVSGFPVRAVPKSTDAAAQLKKRTLTALYNTRGMLVKLTSPRCRNAAGI